MDIGAFHPNELYEKPMTAQCTFTEASNARPTYLGGQRRGRIRAKPAELETAEAHGEWGI